MRGIFPQLIFPSITFPLVSTTSQSVPYRDVRQHVLKYSIVRSLCFDQPTALVLLSDETYRQIGTNHFGHFHLTDLLLPRMKAQETPSR